MPARRDLTLAEFQAREDARREQSRRSMRRLRAERKAASLSIERLTQPVNTTVSTTPQPVSVTPSPPAPPLPAVSTTQRLLERLAPFASRAFKPDPAFLALLAERYPGVDLELELAAALDWLEEPRHAKRRCSKGFLANWVKKADADRKAREQAPPPHQAGLPSRRELVLQQPYHQPQSQQPNRQPDRAPLFTHELQPVAREEWRRALDQRARVPFEVKLAQARGGAK